jgi:hypothetical protein
MDVQAMAQRVDCVVSLTSDVDAMVPLLFGHVDGHERVVESPGVGGA